MCVKGEIFFKINKRDSTFIREMRVYIYIDHVKYSLISTYGLFNILLSAFIFLIQLLSGNQKIIL